MTQTVSVRQETVYLPTYPVGKPEKNPVFLEKRVYQGSSGVVYPHPVIEKVGNEKSNQPYTALFLENEYLEIMILPQLGGRVHRAYDKIRKRDFVYYNQVIKPALVGLAGPWISGGIEFNWPQHHRPSTFQPVDFTIVENADGSKTVWVNEVELMFRTKCQAGFTLYPGKAYLEVKGKLYNRTPFPQTFLWWANPAVKVNDHYQSVFPPDVHAVFDHGKRDVSSFPIAKGTYYNVDYSPGTDISRYVNIPVPTSYMAIQSKYDFIGGYEHDAQAGMLHVANHHVSPGKKQWTWGCGDFGKAWDRNLTDEDGPYIELMTGMFTDNQPDFSWLHPNEEKTFEQYFMPYSKLGLVKNATKDALVNVESCGNEVAVKVFVTTAFPGSRIVCTDAKGQELQCFETDLSTADAFEAAFVSNTSVETISVAVNDANNRLLVRYEPEAPQLHELPLPATAAKAPADITTNEELFLNGLHLEQYRHATYQPMDYYLEALRRDAGDIRCNNAVGLWLMRHGQLEKALPYFRQAIKTSTLRNPNPYEGEPYYNLGICLSMLGKHDEAYDALYKATWNDAFQHAGFLQLAKIDMAKGAYSQALYHIEKSLVRNYHSHNARHLKAVILRKLHEYDAANRWINDSLEIDPFGYGCLYEGYLCNLAIGNNEGAASFLQRLKEISRGTANNYIEYAIDYGHAGCFEEAISLLNLYTERADEVYPMAYYFMGYFAHRNKDENAAQVFLKKAGACKSDYCFPNKLEELQVLQWAMQANDQDAKAAYYLGNLWFGMRQYDEAIAAFEKSVAIYPNFPTAHRNLALLYYNKRNDKTAALAAMEKAFALDTTDARVLMELDHLYSKLNVAPAKRLAFLKDHLALVEQRDDVYLERIWLENCTGAFSIANDLLSSRKFHPWEGGEGKVVSQYLFIQLMRAMDALKQRDFGKAKSFLSKTEHYPENLGEGKLYGTVENDINYLNGILCEQMGNSAEAKAWYAKATKGNADPKPALFYNDPQPDKILYQGLAWLKLGETQKAENIFNSLMEYGSTHMKDDVHIDYFAVSLPDILVFEKDLNKSNHLHCTYMMALGELGMGNFDKAANQLETLLQSDAYHLGARLALKLNELLKSVNDTTPDLVAPMTTTNSMS